MQFARHSDNIGIKTGGVLKITWHSLYLVFSDFNSQTYRLGAKIFEVSVFWLTYIFFFFFLHLAKQSFARCTRSGNVKKKKSRAEDTKLTFFVNL